MELTFRIIKKVRLIFAHIKLFDSRTILLLALFLGLALRLPGWFTADAKQRFQLFEPDEMQHVDIALNRFQQLSADTLEHTFTEIFNVRGYGILSGHLAYGWSFVSDQLPNVHDVILLNRQLSTAFALLLIFLVYRLGRGFGLSPSAAGIGALFLAFCDLNATYSHYGIPASGYIMGVFLTVYGGQCYWLGRRIGLLWLALGAAISFAFKFDFIPFVTGGMLLLYCVFKGVRLQIPRSRFIGSSKANKQEQRPVLYYDILLGIGFVALFFGLLTGFSWPLENILESWKTLRAVNENVIESDQHWLENPIVYLAAVIAGIGLPAFGLAVTGLLKIKKSSLLARPDVCLLIGIIFLEFMVRWSIDTPFVRRANVFMPAICLAAAYGCQQLRLSPKLVSAGLAYTLLLALVGQSNHWFDTRIAARAWINEQLPKTATIAATPYVAVKGLRSTKSFQPGSDWDYAVLHESYYHRYGLSMTTPFGYPDCCNEVYHCQGETMCQEIQNLLKNTTPTAELIARFETRNWLPERWIYHQLFGNYETFLGDVLVYRKR